MNNEFKIGDYVRHKRSIAVIAAGTTFALVLLMIGVPALRSVIAVIFVASVAGLFVFATAYEIVEMMQGEDE